MSYIEKIIIDKLKESKDVFKEADDQSDTEIDLYYDKRLSPILGKHKLSIDQTNKLSNSEFTTEQIDDIDINSIPVKNKLTRKYIKAAKLGIIAITAFTLILTLSKDMGIHRQEKIANTFEVLDKDMSNSDVANALEGKAEKDTSTIEDHYTMDNEFEDQELPSKESNDMNNKKESTLISKKAINSLMEREDSELYKGKKKGSIPEWDVKQWSVGYGVNVYGYGADGGKESNPPWLDKKGKMFNWVKKFRETYGIKTKNPGDIEPSKKNPKGAIGKITAELALKKSISRGVPNSFKSHPHLLKNLPKPIIDALIDMTHNIGPDVLNRFSKMTKALEEVAKFYKKGNNISQKNKKKLKKSIHKVVFELSRGKDHNVVSKYFYDTYCKKVSRMIKHHSSELAAYKRRNDTKNKEKLMRIIIEDSRFIINATLILSVVYDEGIALNKAKKFSEDLRAKTSKNRTIIKESIEKQILVKKIRQIIKS